MSKARGLADLGNAYSDGALSNRNLIINGAMQVAQRGTSFVNSSNSTYYTLDRWFMNNSSETITTTQELNTASDAKTTGQRYFMRNVVSTSGRFAGIAQRIENIFQFDGKTVTLSFWARGGGAGGNTPTTFRVYANGISAGTIVDADVFPSKYISLTTDWSYYTVTVSLKALTFASYATSESSTCLHLFFQQTTAETCDFDLTGVQLEVGDTATPFEHRSYGDELQKCMRYYEYSSMNRVMAEYVAGVYMAVCEFKVRKRVTPSITQTNTSGGILYGTDVDGFSFYRSGGSSGYITSFTADAEL